MDADDVQDLDAQELPGVTACTNMRILVASSAFLHTP